MSFSGQKSNIHTANKLPLADTNDCLQMFVHAPYYLPYLSPFVVNKSSYHLYDDIYSKHFTLYQLLLNFHLFIHMCHSVALHFLYYMNNQTQWQFPNGLLFKFILSFLFKMHPITGHPQELLLHPNLSNL